MQYLVAKDVPEAMKLLLDNHLEKPETVVLLEFAACGQEGKPFTLVYTKSAPNQIRITQVTGWLTIHPLFMRNEPYLCMHAPLPRQAVQRTLYYL